MCDTNEICHAFHTKIKDEESIKRNIVLNADASRVSKHMPYAEQKNITTN